MSEDQGAQPWHGAWREWAEARVDGVAFGMTEVFTAGREAARRQHAADLERWSRHLLHTSQHNNMQVALGGRLQRVAGEMREAAGLPEFGWNDAVPDAEFGECSVHASGCRGQETRP